MQRIETVTGSTTTILPPEDKKKGVNDIQLLKYGIKQVGFQKLLEVNGITLCFKIQGQNIPPFTSIITKCTTTKSRIVSKYNASLKNAEIR